MPTTVTKISSLTALGTSPNGGSFLAVSQLVGPSYQLYKVTVSELLANTITSLNGLTSTSQTFATPGTSGTAPNWSSSGSVHTLNIPLASASGVTAGLISKTQYDAAVAPFVTTYSQNLVMASPDGSSGSLSVRALNNSDLPIVLPGKGGTGTSTAFTAGSIVFAGGSGVYTQDNSNLYYNDTDNWLHANKLMLNTTYTGDPYSFVHKSVDSIYNFKFIDSSSNTIISSQAGNLFIAESLTIRSTANYITFGLSVYDGTSLFFNTLGTANGIFTGTNIFAAFNPTIRSTGTDSQTGIQVSHEIEQTGVSTGKVVSFSSIIDQVVNLTRQFDTTIGSNTVTITDTRGTTGLTIGDTVTGVGIPGGTTILSILGSVVTLSNSTTTTVTGGLLTDTSVTYTASDVADFRCFESIIGASSTQSAFYAEDNSANVLFRVGGDGSFTFKGGTYAPAQTGWTITNPTTVRTIDVSTASLSDVRQVLGTLLQDLIDKGIILA